MSATDWVRKDFYRILGVAPDASQAEIKKAYRRLARDHHPDANSGNLHAEERFKEISEAHSVLSDPNKRREYDETRAVFGNGYTYGPAPGAGAGGFDLGDLFGRAGSDVYTGADDGGLGDIFGGLFGGARMRSGGQPRRGADLQAEATLDFAEAMAGVTLPLRLTADGACPACSGTGAKAGTTPRPCPTCRGSGMTTRSQGGVFAFAEPCRDCRGRGAIIDDPCPVCHGAGRTTSTRTIQARVPPGVRDGQRIRLRGKGQPGERGGPSGDLYVTVRVRSHNLFERRGEHLAVTVPVTFTEAALGAEIKVPTLDGPPVTVKLPAGTPNGRTLRVRGRGARRADGTHGDLLVTVQVVVPTELDEDARAALETYRTLTAAEDPRAAMLSAGRR